MRIRVVLFRTALSLSGNEVDSLENRMGYGMRPNRDT